jgi:hypothetical protein
MSDMVERVALAIYIAEIGSAAGWDDYRVVKARHLWFAKARAAIEAMREPTQDMIDACDINIPTEGTITGVWCDMIDAALGKVSA